MYMKPLHSAEWWTFISVYFFSQNPKCRFILFQYTDVHLCAQLSKVWLSKANNRRKATSSNFDLFLSKAQKQHSTRKLHFSFDQMFYKSSRSTDCAAKNLKTRVHCYATGSTWGLTKRNLKKISIFRAIRLCFLRSLVSAIRSKLIRAPGGAKRDPLARAPSKCWGTCGGARAVVRSMWLPRTRAPKWEHVCTTGRYDVKDRRKIGCVMAHSKMRPVRREPTEQNSTRRGGGNFILQANQLGFSRSIGSATSNEANKRAMRRTEWIITARQSVLFGRN